MHFTVSEFVIRGIRLNSATAANKQYDNTQLYIAPVITYKLYAQIDGSESRLSSSCLQHFTTHIKQLTTSCQRFTSVRTPLKLGVSEGQIRPMDHVGLLLRGGGRGRGGGGGGCHFTAEPLIESVRISQT